MGVLNSRPHAPTTSKDYLKEKLYTLSLCVISTEKGLIAEMNIQASDMLSVESFFKRKGVTSVRCNKERDEVVIIVPKHLSFHVPAIIR